VADLEAAVSRVLALGGRKLKAVSEYGIEWAVMADPDGNEFCLIKHAP
jgi:predicted enzyme related to lactoylglutathione lyase